MFGGAVRVYCSAACLHQREPLPAAATTQTTAEPLKPRRRRAWLLVPLLGVAGSTAWFVSTQEGEESFEPPAPAMSTLESPGDPKPPTVSDPREDPDIALVADLARDAWIHPLAGPMRRMPVNHNGAFGAERPGERPPECISGHCGVDVGSMWGERVYAVHEGVVEFVQRGPNDEAGGMFVKVAHRGGSLYSWYFHLSAIPRAIRPGAEVAPGTLIGLLGDTGVKSSGPHLHFSLSVRTSKHSERYLDPEPLIAIWPLWLPNEDGRGGHLSTVEAPGVPVRSGGKRAKPREVAPAPSEPPPSEPVVAPAT